MLATSDPINPDGGPRPAFRSAIWGWGPVCGLALWAIGFLILPWWAALFLWWWPSVLIGAASGLAIMELATRLTRATRAARDNPPAGQRRRDSWSSGSR
jgi:hypothetical protein